VGVVAEAFEVATETAMAERSAVELEGSAAVPAAAAALPATAKKSSSTSR
jgi:hypothetical protein